MNTSTTTPTTPAKGWARRHPWITGIVLLILATYAYDAAFGTASKAPANAAAAPAAKAPQAPVAAAPAAPAKPAPAPKPKAPAKPKVITLSTTQAVNMIKAENPALVPQFCKSWRPAHAAGLDAVARHAFVVNFKKGVGDGVKGVKMPTASSIYTQLTHECA